RPFIADRSTRERPESHGRSPCGGPPPPTVTGDGAPCVESMWKRPVPHREDPHVTTTEPRHPGLPDSGHTDGGVGTTVVLDTCVLLADPDSLYAFGDADIVIPLT